MLRLGTGLVTRLLVVALICPLIGSTTGCAVWERILPARRAPCALEPGASYSQIVGKVNQNFEPQTGPPLSAWECMDVSLSMNGMPLDATVSVEAPHRLRLRVSGKISGSQYAALGSNDEEVWFWGQGAQGVIRASHQDLPLFLSQVQIPLDPDWLMEVLGVIRIDPDQYELRRTTPETKYVELVSERSALTGDPVRRVIRIDTCYGQIEEHRIESFDGTLIARALLYDYGPDASQRYMLPHSIQVELPQPETQITFRLRNIQTDPERLANLDWSVPHINGYAHLRVGQPRAHHSGEATGILTGNNQGVSRARIRLPVMTVDAPPGEYSGAALQLSSDPHHPGPESVPRPFP